MVNRSMPRLLDGFHGPRHATRLMDGKCVDSGPLTCLDDPGSVSGKFKNTLRFNLTRPNLMLRLLSDDKFL